MQSFQFNSSAVSEGNRLGVHRTTLIAAIHKGECGGEKRNGHWYTSRAAAAEWYSQRYRLRDTLYSQASGKPWSKAEVTTLRELLAANAPEAEIAARLKRAPLAVRTKISKLRREGVIPSVAERKAALALAAARELVAKAETATPTARKRPMSREEHKEGRVRLHLPPAVKAELARAAEAAGVTLTTYLTRAGMAAVADPTILERGKAEVAKLCDTSPSE